MARKPVDLSRKTAGKTTGKTSSARTVVKAKKQEVDLSVSDYGSRQSFASEGTTPLSSIRKFAMLNKKIIIPGILLAIIIVILVLNKSWIVAATVNGSPIFTPTVLQRINNQFREQVLAQMVNEKLILDEAGKKGISITLSEVDERVAKIEGEVGGPEKLDAFLMQQQQTRDDLRSQLRLQLTVEKLYANESTVSAEEVDAFLAENSAQLMATEAAKQREEAEQALKQQKLTKAFNESFVKLRESANIQVY